MLNVLKAGNKMITSKGKIIQREIFFNKARITISGNVLGALDPGTYILDWTTRDTGTYNVIYLLSTQEAVNKRFNITLSNTDTQRTTNNRTIFNLNHGFTTTTIGQTQIPTTGGYGGYTTITTTITNTHSGYGGPTYTYRSVGAQPGYLADVAFKTYNVVNNFGGDTSVTIENILV